MLFSSSLRKVRLLACAGASLFALNAGAALAQNADQNAAPAAEEAAAPSGVEEIVVTAQRRAENLQDTPIAITALTSNALQASGITDLTGVVQATPSLYFAPYPNSSTTLVLFMRGQGIGDPGIITKDGGVGLYLDGIYLARPQVSTFDLADVERVEVLRGPQGTLYGRNTTGGAVNIVTRKPSGELNLRGQLSVGNYDYRRALLNLDLPAFGDFKVKLTGLYSERDGWAKNSGKGDGVTPEANDFQSDRKYAGRAAVRWEPTDNLTVDYSADYSNIRTTPVRYVTNNAFAPFLFPGYNSDVENTYRPVYLPYSKAKSDGQSLIVEWQPSDSLTLRSLSGYRHLNYRAYQDYVEAFLAPFASNDIIKSKQYTQEFQAVGSIGDRVKYVGGLYYFLEKATHDQTIDVGTGVPGQMVLNDRNTYAKSTSAAVYGQVTWTPPVLDDNLELTVGGRYTEDKRNALRERNSRFFIGQTSPLVYRDFLGQGVYLPLGLTYGETMVKNNKFNPAFILNYKITPDVTFYGKLVTGYKSGGANEASPTFTRTFNPETVTTYEIGLKSDLLDRRVRLNLNAFYAKYKDLQLDISADAADASQADTFNVGTAKVKGLEADLTIVPIDDITLTASYTYIDNKIKNVRAPAGSIFDPVVNPASPVNVGDNISGYFVLPFTPKNSLRLSGDWTFLRFNNSSIAAHLDYTWKDKVFTTAGNGPSVPMGRDAPVNKAYGLVDGRVTYTYERSNGKNISLALWGKNILDKRYVGFVIGSGSILDGFANQALSYGDPATYGLELSFDF